MIHIVDLRNYYGVTGDPDLLTRWEISSMCLISFINREPVNETSELLRKLCVTQGPYLVDSDLENIQNESTHPPVQKD